MKYTIDFFKWLESQPTESRIVYIRSKHTGDKDWTYHKEILEVCDGDYMWLNDWDEGQPYVEILGCVVIDDIDIKTGVFK